MVRHRQTNVSIIHVVVLSFALTMCQVERSNPLHPMTHSFRMAKCSTRLSTPRGISRATAGASNVDAGRSFLKAFIARRRRTVIIPTFIRLGNAWMRPNAPSRLLISLRLHRPAVVGRRMLNVQRALQRNLVACMRYMSPFFQGVEGPLSGNFFELPLDEGGTNNAIYGQVVVIKVLLMFLNGAQFINVLPTMFFVLRFRVVATFYTNVIIRGRFVALPITLA